MNDTHQTVHSSIDLLVNAAALALSVLNSSIDQALVGGLVRSSEDERGVRSRVLRLVDIDS